MKSKKKWARPRHKVVLAIARFIIGPVMKIKYHIHLEPFDVGDRNWLILSNHQTDYDQFFIAKVFKIPVYFVAMEDIFSNGFVSKIIKWAVAPIPFKKASNDIRAVMNCLRIAKEGGTIGLFPEGNRTYSGRTCYIKPSVAPLIQKLGLPIAIFRIEDGYGIKPRWANETRKGKMTGRVAKVIEPEEYKDLSKEELYDLVCKELWVDEAVSNAEFTSDHLAEGLEKVLYICPDCGLSEFESSGDTFTCKHCGRKYKYLPNKQIVAVEGESRFKYVADWYDYQEETIRNMDLSPYISKEMFSDVANISEVVVYEKKRPVKTDAHIHIYGNRLEVDDLGVFDYDDVKAMACIADHKLNIFYKDKIYQIKGDKSFNALKYCNIFYHDKFVKEGNPDGEFQFLGL